MAALPEGKLVVEMIQRFAATSHAASTKPSAPGSDPADGFGLVGTSEAMQQLRRAITLVARSERPVLVTGPTGSGKELVVRAIHQASTRCDRPFMELNCAAFPSTLIESELFGHERGAFTGADRRRDGFFAAAGRGTLFLDEIAELALDLQSKLLRVLETRTYRMVGSNTTQHTEARIIAATHVNLEARVAAGQFREDLLYRLNVLEVRVPSLSERLEDLPLLLEHFVQSAPHTITFTDTAIDALKAASWPGNVRQLRNLVDRIAVFSGTERVDSQIVRRFLQRAQPLNPLSDLVRSALQNLDNEDKVALVTGLLIDEALRLNKGNLTAAARMLGVHRKYVERRLKKARLADE